MRLIVKSALLVCMAAAMSSCNEAAKESKSNTVTVNVARTVATQADCEKEYSFISKPFRSSELSFRVGGPIDRFDVYAGNFYKKGDIIAEIDPRDFRIRKERAAGIYAQAKAEYERIKVLFEKNNISASAFEKARADYTSAKAAYETAENELTDTRLVAPFNGYVGEVFIEKYQDVKATQPVISFVDIDQLKIEAYVTQDIAFNLPAQTNVRLQFDALPEKSFEAKVAEVSKSTTPNNLSYLLTALLPNKDGKLLSGMSGKIVFNLSGVAAEPILTVSQTSVCHRPKEGDYVWVVNTATSQVHQRKITLGRLLPDGVVCVTSGLKEGEVLATSSLRLLAEGMTVNVSTYER